MDRSRLIFFASSDPVADPGPARSAYHFADMAARCELDAEVRLAGDAVRVASPAVVPATPLVDELADRARKARGGPFLVSL